MDNPSPEVGGAPGYALPDGLAGETKQGCWLRVKVVPHAKRQEVLGLVGNALKISLTAAPEKGEANANLLRFLAQLFRLPKSHVRLQAGMSSREKLVVLVGIPLSRLQAVLQEVLTSK
ncbi:MAG: DUF167 domain-containing protein [Thermoanaerobaculaceae bacterium]